MPPIHPGVTLGKDFLKPLGITAHCLALELRIPPARVTNIIRGHRAITTDTSLRLARYFGTSPEFWISLQTNYDLDVGRGSSRLRNQAG